MESSGIKISMDGKGRATDNAFIERLWRSVKYDYGYIKVPADGLELYHGLKNYFDCYNYRLGHQGIGDRIPSSLYSQKAA